MAYHMRSRYLICIKLLLLLVKMRDFCLTAQSCFNKNQYFLVVYILWSHQLHQCPYFMVLLTLFTTRHELSFPRVYIVLISIAGLEILLTLY